jgi:hypothetical protein
MENRLGGEIGEMFLSTPLRPPDLRLVPCCSTCRYGRTEGISVECKKFNRNGIASHAICNDYETL